MAEERLDRLCSSADLFLNSPQSHVPYAVLLDWWSQHSYGRQCYIGLGIYKAGTTAGLEGQDLAYP